MYVTGRLFDKVIDCFYALESSCKNAYKAEIENYERIVNVTCTLSNLDGNNVIMILKKVITVNALVWLELS